MNEDSGGDEAEQDGQCFLDYPHDISLQQRHFLDEIGGTPTYFRLNPVLMMESTSEHPTTIECVPLLISPDVPKNRTDIPRAKGARLLFHRNES